MSDSTTDKRESLNDKDSSVQPTISNNADIAVSNPTNAKSSHNSWLAFLCDKSVIIIITLIGVIFTLMASHFSSINSQLANINASLIALNKSINDNYAILDAKIITLSNRVDEKIANLSDKMTEQFEIVDERLYTLNNTVSGLEIRLTNIEKILEPKSAELANKSN